MRWIRRRMRGRRGEERAQERREAPELVDAGGVPDGGGEAAGNGGSDARGQDPDGGGRFLRVRQLYIGGFHACRCCGAQFWTRSVDDDLEGWVCPGCEATLINAELGLTEICGCRQPTDMEAQAFRGNFNRG